VKNARRPKRPVLQQPRILRLAAKKKHLMIKSVANRQQPKKRNVAKPVNRKTQKQKINRLNPKKNNGIKAWDFTKSGTTILLNRFFYFE
jgi:hypothetical protein